MKQKLLLFCISLFVCHFAVAQSLPAFPGAEGYGRYTTGGRGGIVYHVTNLNDSGEGSLRYALETLSEPRIVVFDVGGTIALSKELSVKNGNVTIAGQTAPGDGICLKNYSLNVNSDNVIVRFIRCRMGDEKAAEGDAMWGRNHKNVIIDHCTMSWSTDECASFYGNSNFTMQWCFISESLCHSVHEKGDHGYGGIWGGQNATFHHNLIAHHTSRTPRLCGSRYTARPDLEHVDLRNNVFYNWGPTNSGYAGEGGTYNFVNNYYKPGPSTNTKSSLAYRIFSANADDGTNSQERGIWGTFHLEGNYFDVACLSSSNATNAKKVNADNYVGLHYDTGNGALPGGTKNGIICDTLYDFAPVSTQTAQTAYQKVMAVGGASLVRDVIDSRIVEDVETGSFYSLTYNNTTTSGVGGSTYGIIDTQSDVEGFITYKNGTKPTDSNNDGIADDWAAANIPENASAITLTKSGYTYFEIYINSLVEDIMKQGVEEGDSVFNDFVFDTTPVGLNEGQTWNFTSWSQATLDNLAADEETWSLASETRYQNLKTLSGTLTANGANIIETEGLTFSSCAKNNIRIDFGAGENASRLILNGGSLGITIPNCVGGDVISIDFCSANSSSARGWTSTNTDVATGEKVTERTTQRFTVQSAGSAIFKTTGGLQIFGITLNEGGVPSAITVVDREAKVVSQEYFTVTGARIPEPVKGINIVRARMDDGSIKTTKLFIK